MVAGVVMPSWGLIQAARSEPIPVLTVLESNHKLRIQVAMVRNRDL
jgi:hypothetical protein